MPIKPMITIDYMQIHETPKTERSAERQRMLAFCYSGVRRLRHEREQDELWWCRNNCESRDPHMDTRVF